MSFTDGKLTNQHHLSEQLEKLQSPLQLCFVAGTPVLTPSGPRPIETLKPGDWVVSRPDTCDPTQTPARPRRVVNLFETHPIEVYQLAIVTPEGRREALVTTGESSVVRGDSPVALT